MGEQLWLKISGGGLIALCAYLFGAFDIALQTLIIFILADFISGTVNAIVIHTVSWEKNAAGFGKKLMMIMGVVLAVRLDALLGMNGVIRYMYLYGCMGTELYSILQNFTALGVLPPGVAKYFDNYAQQLSNMGSGVQEAKK